MPLTEGILNPSHHLWGWCVCDLIQGFTVTPITYVQAVAVFVQRKGQWVMDIPRKSRGSHEHLVMCNPPSLWQWKRLSSWVGSFRALWTRSGGDQTWYMQKTNKRGRKSEFVFLTNHMHLFRALASVPRWNGTGWPPLLSLSRPTVER